MKTAPLTALALCFAAAAAHAGPFAAKGCATPRATDPAARRAPDPAKVAQAKPSGTGTYRATRQRGSALAIITFYYPGQDRYGWSSATGARLKPWVTCAVDPKRIPYGSRVTVAGLGTFIAHDTGSAVKSRLAARKRGHGCPSVLVIDICAKSRDDMRRAARSVSHRPVPVKWG